MPIRLIFAAKKLKKSVNELAAFLQRLGYDVKANPNFKISEYEYSLLIDNFLKKEDIYPWDRVYFYDGYILVYLNSERYFKYDLKESKKSYNEIKFYIQCKLPPIKIRYESTDNIQIVNELDLDKALLFLSRYSENNFEVIENDIKKSRFYHLYELGDFVETLIENKSIYIRYLSEIQDLKYRIVPILEVVSYTSSLNHHITYEEAFIFTIQKAETNIIILENISEQRSTIIFRLKNASYMDAVHSIFDFFTSKFKNKRDRIRCKNVLINGISEYSSINHTNFDEWKRKIFYSINS